MTETYTYDDLGRILTATNPKGEISNYAYNNVAGGQQTTITKNLENSKIAKTILIYGSGAQYAYPTTIKEYYTNSNGSPIETVSNKTYDLLSGLIKTETDHNGNTTSYTFDKLGRITSLKLPNYNTVDSDSYEAEQKYEYDYATCAFFDTTNANLITTSIYSYIQYKDLATGTIAKYDERESFYDGFGNLRLQDLWDFDRGEWVVQSQYHYDNLARPNYFIDAEGNSSTFAYNPWGILYKTVDPHANVYQTDYELIPRKYTSYFMQQGTTTRQNVVETSLDQWEQVVQKKAYPNWPNTADPIWETYTYDINGNAITHTDPNGNTTNYAYDQLDRITQVIDPLNQTTEYQYTVLGEIKSIKQSDGAKNWITSQEYDELARLTRKAAPSGAAEQFTPNALGLLQQRTDLNQNTFSYTYDAHKREINKTGPASSFAYTYYHPLGVTWIEQYNNNAQLIGLQGFNYNPKGQISYTIQYSDAYNHQTYYAYDKTGTLTSVRDPFSHTTLYGYNKNRLTRVQTNGSATASTADAANARYEYYPNGMLKSVTYPQLTDGSYLKANYEYDEPIP